MAVYKFADVDQLEADLEATANAIRTKGGTSEKLAFPNGFADAINKIEIGPEIHTAEGYIELDLAAAYGTQYTIDFGFNPDYIGFQMYSPDFPDSTFPWSGLPFDTDRTPTGKPVFDSVVYDAKISVVYVGGINYAPYYIYVIKRESGITISPWSSRGDEPDSYKARLYYKAIKYTE